jgi:hypothetical protein
VPGLIPRDSRISEGITNCPFVLTEVICLIMLTLYQKVRFGKLVALKNRAVPWDPFPLFPTSARHSRAGLVNDAHARWIGKSVVFPILGKSCQAPLMGDFGVKLLIRWEK